MLATYTMTDRGPVAGIDGTNVFLQTGDTATAQTATALEALVTHAVHLSDTTKEDAMQRVLLASTAGHNAIAAASVTYGAFVQRKRDGEKANRVLMERAPSVADDRFDPHFCAIYRELSDGEQIARISAASLPELAAIQNNAALAGLGPHAQELATERYIALNWSDRVGLAGSYPKQPSLDGDVLATGVDHAAVENAASVALAQHRQRLEQAKDDEGVMRNLIATLAAAFGLSQQEILNRVIS